MNDDPTTLLAQLTAAAKLVNKIWKETPAALGTSDHGVAALMALQVAVKKVEGWAKTT